MLLGLHLVEQLAISSHIWYVGVHYLLILIELEQCLARGIHAGRVGELLDLFVDLFECLAADGIVITAVMYILHDCDVVLCPCMCGGREVACLLPIHEQRCTFIRRGRELIPAAKSS